jgi:CRISPR-associated protein Cas5a/b/c
MAIGFIVDMEFVWGFQARVAGLSKTSPSFLYPPPTVILGGIAESIARRYEIGESNGRNIIPILSRKLLAIGIKPLNCTPITYQAINRIIAIRYAGGILYPTPEPKYILKSFDAPARGSTILSTIDNNAPMIRLFIVFKNNEFVFDSNKFKLKGEDLWRIHRIGTKESLVSILNVVSTEKISVLRDNVIVTSYSFPMDSDIDIIIPKGSWREEVYINPFKLEAYNEDENPFKNYMSGNKLIKFNVPLKTPIEDSECKLRIKGKIVGYSYEGEVVVGYGED